MRKTNYLLIVLACLSLNACIPLIFGGATTAGVVAAQERSAGNAVDDLGIRLAINNRFFNKDINDLYRNVTIKVTEGRVLLTGDVDKPENKIRATELSWGIKGVREVINEIQVNDKSGIADYANDSWIANQVRAKFLLEKNLRSVNYNVEVVNAVVYLFGIAQDKNELDKANYIASTTSGVKQVINHVVMKEDQRRVK